LDRAFPERSSVSILAALDFFFLEASASSERFPPLKAAFWELFAVCLASHFGAPGLQLPSPCWKKNGNRGVRIVLND